MPKRVTLQPPSPRVRLLRNYSSLTLAQLAATLLPLLTIPHLTRALGPQLYGVVGMGVALSQAAAVLVDFGFSLVATRDIARQSANATAVNRIASRALVCKLPLLTIVCLGWALFLFLDRRFDEFELYFLLLLPGILGVALQPTWLFQGMERMGYLAAMLLSSRVVYVAMVLTFVGGPDDYLWVAGATSVSAVLGCAMALLGARRLGFRFAMPGQRECLHSLAQATPFFFSRAANGVYTAGPVVFLGAVSGPGGLAAYSIADQIYRAAQTMFTPVTQALYPYMVRLRDLRLLHRVLFFSEFACVTVLASALLVADPILETLTGPGYDSVGDLLAVLLIAFCFAVPSALLGYPLLGAWRRSDLANRTVVAGALVHIALLIVLMLVDGVSGHGVASAVLVTEASMLLMRVWLSRRVVMAEA